MPDREQDFDLQILRVGDRYGANVIKSPAREADGEFDLPFTGDELDNLFRGLGQARSRTRGAASPEVATATDFGTRLFDKVFSGDVRDCLSNSRGRATFSGANLRIRLRLTKVPELLDLPWELLFDRLSRRFLALDGSTTLVRHLPVAEPVVPMHVTPPLRVLVAISNPRRDLDVDQEWAKLSGALDGLTARGLVGVERLQPATFEGLHATLDAGSFHVLHFVGHGHYDPARQGGYLSFETTAAGEKRVGAVRLADLLRPYRTLRLVVLNACEGGRTSREDPFAGVAQSLVQSAIPAVVAMQFPVSDDAAVTFAGAFYGALAAGRPVDLALAAARRAVNLKGEEGDIEWATPVLYMRGDGQLFDVSAVSGPTVAQQLVTPPREPPEKPDSPTDLDKTTGEAARDEILPPPPPTKWTKPVLSVLFLVLFLAWGVWFVWQSRRLEEERLSPAQATRPEAPRASPLAAPPKAEAEAPRRPAAPGAEFPTPTDAERLKGESKAAAGQIPQPAGRLLDDGALASIAPRLSLTKRTDMLPYLQAAMKEFGINTPVRQAAFVAQVAYETGGFEHFVENLNVSWKFLRNTFPKYFPDDAIAQEYEKQPERIANRVYANRLGNGPEESGDGWRYRGRGPLLMVGRDTYRKFGQALGLDLEHNPDQAAEYSAGFRLAAALWQSKGLNELAEQGDINTITRRLTGGVFGLDERQNLYVTAKRALGV